MFEYITSYRNFCQRQIEFLAELDATDSIVAFCACSLSADASACMRRSRARAHRSRRNCGAHGKSNDPDPDSNSPGHRLELLISKLCYVNTRTVTSGGADDTRPDFETAPGAARRHHPTQPQAMETADERHEQD
jgi:hypothetical protein